MLPIGLTRPADFEPRVLRAQRPVLVTFRTESDSPSLQLFPALSELAAGFASRVDVVAVDINQCPEIAKTYEIRGIPTMILFRDGVPVARKYGSLPHRILAAWLEEQLA